MRNIIITGGELFNKGAQAMLFIAVDEIKKRFPNHQIYILSDMDFQRPQSEKEKYAFNFIGWHPVKFAKCQKNPFLRLLCKLRNGAELREAEDIYSNTDMMIDISGYALGSIWSVNCCTLYLEHLEYAKEFGIPVYIMPQSFGPFKFEGEQGRRLDKKIKKLLPSVKMICAREQEGYDLLVNTYHLQNVCVKRDIVLNNKGIDINNIYKQVPTLSLPDIAQNSVAIIPNGQTLVVNDKEQILRLYYSVICELLSEGKVVYLLSHSTQDKEFCEQIKNDFRAEERVILLEQDFSCIEFNELVKKFEFVIASRFHSIVHAYKNGVPCVVLGWAVKYHELTSLFGQEQYMFDARNEITIDEVIRAVRRMNACVEDETKKISECLATVQKENVFDILSMEK